MAWLGLKTLAYVPLTRSNVPSDVPPPDWANQIMQRVYDDIDQTTHVDRSLRAYIHTVSSGLADLRVVVQPPQAIVGTGAGGTDVAPDALEARLGNQLRAQGYDGAAIVMLGGPGGGSTRGCLRRTADGDIAARGFAAHVGTHLKPDCRAALRSLLTRSALSDARRSEFPL